MTEKTKYIESLLQSVKSNIDTHFKFKEKYNKQLAIDFNLFQFFSIGENKISQILAFFLDINQNHGQGDVFLKEFIKTFYGEILEIKQLSNTCEKVITKKRRIDIYIELDCLTIAIENKVWADDQVNQLRDYASFLEKETQGNYQLIYLNPYGEDPNPKSIDKEFKNSLIKQNKFKVIGYRHDIIPLINNWLIICEADNVLYFLKEFKRYLEIEFLGKNTLNMSKELREIIRNNQREVQSLVKEYKQIEIEIVEVLNNLWEKIDYIDFNTSKDIKVDKVKPFNYRGLRILKCSLSDNDGNKVWVQFEKKEIDLFINYYLQEGTDLYFNDILLKLGFTNNEIVDYKQDETTLINIFKNQVKIVNDSFKEYEKQNITE